MQTDLTRAIPVLRREYLFEGLETAQIARVARFFDQLDYKSGRVIFCEGDEPDFFYLILDGKIRITRRKRGRNFINFLSPGDFFGEMALLFRNKRSFTAACEEDVTLLRLSPNRFQLLLREYPQIRKNIAATAGSRKLLHKMKFDWMGNEEVVYFVTRKHYVFLLVRLFLPTLVFLFAAAKLIISMFGGSLVLPELALFGLLLILSTIFFAWSWVDWGNDYYIVTNQRTVWQEKILGFFDSRREAPLDVILSVNVSSGFFGRLFGFGSVDVRTYSGGILMRRMSNPNQFASFIEGYKKRVIAINEDEDRKMMEQALDAGLRRQQSTGEEEEFVVAEKPPIIFPVVRKKKTPSRIQEWLRTFMKVRYEEAGTVTYRKHIFVLGKKSSVPLALLLIMVIITSLTFQPSLVYISISLSVFLGIVFWLWYVYEDWRNDIYRLTPEQILDIEKKPLGREQKKTSRIDAPDFRVEHTRNTFWNILLNYGTVTVNIGQTQFVFHDVYNPDQVHQDISDFREALIRRQQKEKTEKERARMVDWLIAFHEKSGKMDESEEDLSSDEVLR